MIISIIIISIIIISIIVIIRNVGWNEILIILLSLVEMMIVAVMDLG